MQSAPPTSHDVARKAGVSQSTVSLVLSGKASGRVSQHTQMTILQAAQDLGYQPHQAARVLRSGRTRLIVLAVPDVSNPYFAALLQGVEKSARTHYYAVMMVSIYDDQDYQHVILDALHSRTIDGCLLCSIPYLFQHEDPILNGRIVQIETGSESYPDIHLDLTTAIQQAMAHLIQLGHRRIAHLGAAVEMDTFAVRHTAYRAALQYANIPYRPDYYVQAPFLLAATTAAAHTLLTTAQPPTAIFCDSDMLAVGVYKAAKALGRRIPEDISVVSIDDSAIARLLEPELTTLAIPTTELGEQAFLLLRTLLEEGYRYDTIPSQTLPLTLTIRNSTAVCSSHQG